jgi:hypothetical protein
MKTFTIQQHCNTFTVKTTEEVADILSRLDAPCEAHITIKEMTPEEYQAITTNGVDAVQHLQWRAGVGA